MEINDFLNDDKKMAFDLDSGKTYLALIELMISNQTYLRSILKRQVEIKELLNKNPQTDFDNAVIREINELEKNIYDVSSKEYYQFIQKIIK